jgi:homogentisate 1,2-dioxygenase
MGNEPARDGRYMTGFGNSFESEALPGALPIGRNSPQRCAYGLYAEQISGSPFTAPRGENQRSWLYRIRPTVAHWRQAQPLDSSLWLSAPGQSSSLAISPLRWDPIPIPQHPLSFVDGIRTITTAGDVGTHSGMGVHIYVANRSMENEFLYNADGEFLIVPQSGSLKLHTEFGLIEVGPGDIAVIPRGVKFRAVLPDGPARGYICENYGSAFALPERGPIGANCLANPRDFETPVAAFEDVDATGTLFVRWGGKLWSMQIEHSPLDVVAWHGNYAPYKYDLRRFSPVGPVHFVIFPDRWSVSEDTFRPPWYHMNCMSEFMGLIYGRYDAKPTGFIPGGFSLHNTMLPHGPDMEAFQAATQAELKPVKMAGSIAFMFETRFPQQVTPFAANAPELQKDYSTYGKALKKYFTADKR